MSGKHDEHRWSGWPGAWCLDCGQEDLSEICVSSCPDMDDEKGPCEKHRNPPCPSPGAKKADPYHDADSAGAKR